MKLATWNMQGASHATENKWQSGVMQLLSGVHQYTTPCDFVCLQECGSLPNGAEVYTPPFNLPPNVTCATWGGSRNPYYIVFYYWGQRVNQAIVSSQPPTEVGLLASTGQPQWREALGAVYARPRGNLGVFSLHAISPDGPDAKGLLEAIGSALSYPWIAGGDFNREPLPDSDAYVCLTTLRHTYSCQNTVKTLDWCATSFFDRVVGDVGGFFLSDHWPVVYDGLQPPSG